jgi:RNA polymerase sigma factor (sigma-70 family)
VNNIDLKIDSPLIEGCREGNIRSQYRLYNKYSKAMYNLACRMLNNRTDAEDVLQEAFTDCFANIRSFRYESTFGAWLKSIVVNKCINQISKRKPALVFDDHLPNVAEEITDSEPEYDHRKIFKAIEKLPDGYRVVLTLYLLEGYDHEEISTILGISESTSKSQYMRAKEKLRKIMKDGQVRRQS